MQIYRKILALWVIFWQVILHKANSLKNNNFISTNDEAGPQLTTMVSNLGWHNRRCPACKNPLELIPKESHWEQVQEGNWEWTVHPEKNC